MYTKILLVIIILILSAFFYLHTMNPGEVTFVVTSSHTYVMPVTLLVFAGFFAGIVIAVLNSIIVDAKRAIKEIKARRERKALAQSEEGYRKGVEALFKGDITQARTLIEKAIRLKPNDTGMIISLAETFIRENRPEEALKVLEDGATSNPSSIDILLTSAKCFQAIGKDDKAARAFSEVLKLDPKNPYALKKLRDLKIKEMGWPEAVALQKAIVELEQNPLQRESESRLLSGLLYEAANKSLVNGNANEAMSRIKEILKNDVSFVPAHILLGEILYRDGNSSNAVKVWEKACNRYSAGSAPILLKLEDLYLKESAPDKILERYKRELNSNPNNVNLRLLLSRLYLRLEMIDNAIEELERLVQDGEDAFYTQILLGEAYLRRNQNNKAAYLFQKALELDREFLPPFRCASCGHMANSWAARCASCGDWNTFQMNSSSPAKILNRRALN